MAGREDEDVETGPDNRSKESRDAAKALDSMTNRVPESQELDEGKVQKAVSALAADQQADQAALKQREKELAAVKVSKEDIDVVALEMEVDKKVAERRLREHGGDLAAALTSFMQ